MKKYIKWYDGNWRCFDSSGWVLVKTIIPEQEVFNGLKAGDSVIVQKSWGKESIKVSLEDTNGGDE